MQHQVQQKEDLQDVADLNKGDFWGSKFGITWWFSMHPRFIEMDTHECPGAGRITTVTTCKIRSERLIRAHFKVSLHCL